MTVDEKKVQFIYDDRLGIHIPDFRVDWEDLSLNEQLKVIDRWEKERAKIPDRIKELEEEIMKKQDEMFEIPFEEFVEVHKEIVDLSSAINDLNIWFRTHGHVTEENNNGKENHKEEQNIHL
ncbi:hypothetical protein [Tepidibacillus fermentans]|uniref:Uncharacterized protein n=1 Tax=Tepidibacillus fermentans TaxID=1281767 RepID=A0A4R3KKL8_9BACI|nr:hypothetical protein [Tepidibacillus fermentans]TCS84187.1 hypothetical protein EDD72_102231 [Tepidibacillus fermentans]